MSADDRKPAPAFHHPVEDCTYEEMRAEWGREAVAEQRRGRTPPEPLPLGQQLPDPESWPEDRIRIIEPTPELAVVEGGGTIVRNASRYGYFRKATYRESDGRVVRRWERTDD